MGKRLLFFLTVILFLLVISAAVSADQNGNYRYCNRDQYGCWVTEDDGRRSYIMFWSEEARAYFMGGKSAPESLVTVKPNTHSGRFEMEKAPSRTRTWRDFLVEMLMKHGDYLESILDNFLKSKKKR